MALGEALADALRCGERVALHEHRERCAPPPPDPVTPCEPSVTSPGPADPIGQRTVVESLVDLWTPGVCNKRSAGPMEAPRGPHVNKQRFDCRPQAGD